MKKVLLTLGAAALALVACNKSQTVVSESAHVIGFKAAANVATKADPELVGNTLTSAYSIFAAASTDEDPTYFGKTKFTTEDGTPVAESSIYKPATALYWPIGGAAVDFLAYATPSAADAVPGEFAAARHANNLTFANWDTYANQLDIVYAAANDQTDTKNPVLLTFNHAQALLGFTAKASKAGVFTINSITIKNLLTKGTLTIDNTRNTPEASWGSFDAAADQTLPGLPATALTTTSAPLGDHLLIPSQTACDFVINYTIGTKTYDYVINNVRTNWQAGKKYIYALYFDINEINFQEIVADWGIDVTFEGFGSEISL